MVYNALETFWHHENMIEDITAPQYINGIGYTYEKMRMRMMKNREREKKNGIRNEILTRPLNCSDCCCPHAPRFETLLAIS